MDELKHRYDVLRKRGKTGMLIIIIGIPFILIPFIGFPIILIGCSLLYKNDKELKSLYKKIFVERALVRNFENVIYDPNKGFSKEQVGSFKLCKMDNFFSSEDYISAVYNGIPFEVSDVKSKFAGENQDKTYFSGRMMIFNLSEKSISQLFLFSDSYKYRVDGEWLNDRYKVEFESVEFNKQYDVYSINAEEAFYFLTPALMERFQKLSEKYKSMAMSVTGNRVILGFNEPNNNAFDSKLSSFGTDEEESQKINEDIEDIKRLISAFLMN